MPQGRKVARLAHVPESGTYERKREVDTSGPRKMPKSAKAAANVNMGFIKALGTMTRNAEQIAAGKLVRTGKVLTMPDLQQQAGRQLEIDRKAGEKAVFDPEARKHVKGMRGTFDLDELGELVPALRSKLDDVKKKRSEAARAAKAAVASFAGLMSGAGVPAPSAEGGAEAGGDEDEEEDEEGGGTGAVVAAGAARLAGGKRGRAAPSGGEAAAMVRALAGALQAGGSSVPRGAGGLDSVDPPFEEDEGGEGEEAEAVGADADGETATSAAAAAVRRRRERRKPGGQPAAAEASAAGTAAAALRAQGIAGGVSAPQESLQPLFEPLRAAAAAGAAAPAGSSAAGAKAAPPHRVARGAAKAKAAPAVATTRAALFAQLCELGGGDDDAY